MICLGFFTIFEGLFDETPRLEDDPESPVDDMPRLADDTVTHLGNPPHLGDVPKALGDDLPRRDSAPEPSTSSVGVVSLLHSAPTTFRSQACAAYRSPICQVGLASMSLRLGERPLVSTAP
jgi:hypothetical protein